MKRGSWLIIAIILIGLITIYLTFFYYPRCKDISCWDAKLEKCGRAKFLNDAPDITWEYKIKDKSSDKCIVNVKVLSIKRGLQKTEILEGKSMECELPLGALVAPETDPNLCHGRLKEELQTLIIEKLHQYVLENIGKIGEELTGVQGITQNSTNN